MTCTYIMCLVEVIKLLCVAILLEVRAEKSCGIPNGYAGTCVPLKECPRLRRMYEKPKNDAETMHLMESICQTHFDLKRSKFCCPKSDLPDKYVNPIIYGDKLDKPSTGDINAINRHSIGSGEEPTATKQSNIKAVDNTEPKIQPNTRTIATSKDPPIVGSNTTTITPIALVGSNTPTIVPSPPPVVIPSVPPAIPLSINSNECAPTVVPHTFDVGCCGLEKSSELRITGGSVAQVDQFPWMALLEYDDGSLVCGGTLISSMYVLTAAHCLITHLGEPSIVRLSEYNTTSHPIDRVEVDGGGFETLEVLLVAIEVNIPHELYDNSRKLHDIGLIKMAQSVTYNDFIQPICLPNTDITTSYQDLQLYTAGWGSTGENIVNSVKRYVDLPYVVTSKCQVAHTSQLVETHICAGGQANKDSCAGDSGGPLMLLKNGVYTLVGVVSFGKKQCGVEGSPGVYTHVFKYVDWINSKIRI